MFCVLLLYFSLIKKKFHFNAARFVSLLQPSVTHQTSFMCKEDAYIEVLKAQPQKRPV